MSNTVKKDIVQVKNPKTERYVKIDRDVGKIMPLRYLVWVAITN